jgi:hypothetical protein
MVSGVNIGRTLREAAGRCGSFCTKFVMFQK